MTVVKDQSGELLRGALVSRILAALQNNMPALLLLSGGSAAPAGAAVCREIEAGIAHLSRSGEPVPPCSISLIDERFGPAGHSDSNWLLLQNQGISFSTLIPHPVLTARDSNDTSFRKTEADFASFISHAVHRHQQGELYIAAILGIGSDGHTAGILPGTEAARIPLSAGQFTAAYQSTPYRRITVAPPFFPHIDFAAVWAAGSNKKQVLESLFTPNETVQQPAQLISLAKESMVYTDQEVVVS